MKTRSEIQAKHPERLERGAKFQELRENADLSRNKLAEELGIKASTLSNFEKGQGAYTELEKVLTDYFSGKGVKVGKTKAKAKVAPTPEVGVAPELEYEHERLRDNEVARAKASALPRIAKVLRSRAVKQLVVDGHITASDISALLKEIRG